jgi:MoaA/NifB/PqqE/SkfB family radical SAM enzyme
MTRLIPQADLTRRHGAGRELPVWPAAEPRTTSRQDLDIAIAQATGTAVEADPFNILVLNYTMKCPLACDYCCYTCGPKRPETMDFPLALRLVDQAADLGVFGEFGFTGGEPLVYFDEIVALTTRMAERRIPFSMISACDWAVDDAKTRAYVDPLAERGMSVLTISHDPSHERWVPREHVYRVVDRVLHHNVRVVLCGSFYDDSVDLKKMFPEYVGNPQVDYVTRVVLPTIGRSANKQIVAESYPHTDLKGPDTCYKRFYHDVTVFWDGEVYPCCSVYNRATPGISYGNVYDTPLAEVWDRISGSLFLKMIKRQGFSDLLQLLRERAPDLEGRLPDPTRTVGPCHLCNLLMKDPVISRRVHEVFEAEERARVGELLRSITSAYGEDVARGVMQTVLR